MNYFFKEKLKDRLEYCLDWRRDTELYLMSESLTNKVNEEYYRKRPIRKFLLTIYLLPINLINFFHNLRVAKDLEKNAIEIDYIYSQLDHQEDENEEK